MCHKCDGFTKRLDIETPRRYFELLEKIGHVLDDGTMTLLSGTCAMKDISENKPWPADILQHEFRCASCGRTFTLFVDTYHGRGSWKP